MCVALCLVTMGAFFDSPEPESPRTLATPTLVRELQRQRREFESNQRAENRRILSTILKRPVTDEEVEICAVVGQALLNPPDEPFLDFKFSDFPTTRSLDQIAILLAEAYPAFLITIARNEIRIAWDAT